MEIKISDSNQIAAAIRSAEGRARVRTITPEDIVDVLAQVDKHLSISRRAMEGVSVTVDHNAQAFPRAYRYVPNSTHFKAIFRRGGWYITDIYRAPCARPSFAVRIELTDAAREAVLKRASAISYL